MLELAWGLFQIPASEQEVRDFGIKKGGILVILYVVKSG
jgi:hypothetical protein